VSRHVTSKMFSSCAHACLPGLHWPATAAAPLAQWWSCTSTLNCLRWLLLPDAVVNR
jgi:hypothetical protein